MGMGGVGASGTRGIGNWGPWALRHFPLACHVVPAISTKAISTKDSSIPIFLPSHYQALRQRRPRTQPSWRRATRTPRQTAKRLISQRCVSCLVYTHEHCTPCSVRAKADGGLLVSRHFKSWPVVNRLPPPWKTISLLSRPRLKKCWLKRTPTNLDLRKRNSPHRTRRTRRLMLPSDADHQTT